jgi:thioredoxin reductase
METVDVVIVGGGPAGLNAALMLGRARKRVLLCDAGTPRNAAAESIHGFVTRDGTPPREFRHIAREQLRPYGVEVREVRVSAVRPLASGFQVLLEEGRAVNTRRVLLATGMVDVLPELPGYRELWGRSIFQCPYCHGWEVQGQAFGVLATQMALLDFALLLTGWSRDVTVFTHQSFELSPEQRARLQHAGVQCEERRIRRLLSHAEPEAGGGLLKAVELEDGTLVPRQVLFAAPPQQQTVLVQQLGLALDEQGFVRVNDHRETSIPGIYAAGDLTTRLQGAVMAAAAGCLAAAMLNHALNLESAERGNRCGFPGSRLRTRDAQPPCPAVPEALAFP